MVLDGLPELEGLLLFMRDCLLKTLNHLLLVSFQLLQFLFMLQHFLQLLLPLNVVLVLY